MIRLREYVKRHRSFVRAVYDIKNRINPKNRLRVGKTNQLLCQGARLFGVTVTVHGKNNQIIVGEKSQLVNCTVTICGDGNVVRIGTSCTIREGVFWVEDNQNEIHIGNDTTVSGKTSLSVIEGTTITIGDDCMFSKDISLATGDSHSIVDLEGTRINPSADITVGNHVWVGAHVTMLKGAQVNSHSVIGMRSLVNKPFSDQNVILAGSPAKIVKSGIDWDRKRI